MSNVLKDVLDGIIRTESATNEDLLGLVKLADQLDKRGCVEAADRIDRLVKDISNKRTQPGRNYAYWIRRLKNEQRF